MFHFSTSNCTNCYKCVRSCPVKAIKFSNGKAEIVEEKCIACGKCFVVCPKHARNVENDVKAVSSQLDFGKEIIACIDSAYLGIFDAPGKFVAGLKELGFTSVQEVAVGSEIVSEAYIEFINGHNALPYIISSSCPSVYLFIRKYHPTLAKYLVPVVTPMLALGKAIKKERPNSYTVYIGPCLSRKYETLPRTDSSAINSILTFEEVMRLFRIRGIAIDMLSPAVPDRTAKTYGEEYSISADMPSGLRTAVEQNQYDIFDINGLDNVKDLFESMERKTLDRAYIAISACTESCINGPFTPAWAPNVFARKQKIKNFAEHGWRIEESKINWEDIDLSCRHIPDDMFRPQASQEELQEILQRMGKYNRADELDCGACGYNSCREKAQAVFEGMAEIEMCMPYMRTKAEKMNDLIFLNSRNMIMVLKDDMTVEQFNPAAERAFQISSETIVGKPVRTLIDDTLFCQVLTSRQDIMNRKQLIPNYGMAVIENISFLEKENKILVTMQDVTEDEKRQEELAKLKIQTLDVAQNVIEKQMRVAQEIASLLGETTAETKIALNKLKDVVIKEGD